MAVFGGIGTVVGPILGASVFTFLSETLTYMIGNQYRLILYGVILVLVILFLPDGIISLRERVMGRLIPDKNRGRMEIEKEEPSYDPALLGEDD
jgi:branched-chain amino acid transport system permease protein